MSFPIARRTISHVGCKSLLTSSIKQSSCRNYGCFSSHFSSFSSSSLRHISSSFVNSSFSSFSTQANNYYNTQTGSVSENSNSINCNSVEKGGGSESLCSSSSTSCVSDGKEGTSTTNDNSNDNESTKRKRKEIEEEEVKSDAFDNQHEENTINETDTFNAEELLKLREETELQKSKIKDLQEKLLTAFADIENNRERHIRELENARMYGITNFAKAIIEVADNLTLAMCSMNKEKIEANEEFRSIYDGVKLTENNLLNALNKFHITRYNPLGEQFNPAFHEALFEIEDPTKAKGLVAQVVQTGYKIKDRILRAAKVGVAK